MVATRDGSILHLKMYTFDKVVYQGDVFSVSARNRLGSFDILPGHANMLSIISGHEIVINTIKGPIEYPIAQGIIKVADNQVSIFS